MASEQDATDIERLLLDNLEGLSSHGNAAAKAAVVLQHFRQFEAANAAERHGLMLRSAVVGLEASDAGSLSALVILIVMFTEVDQGSMPETLRSCWGAARPILEIGVDRISELKADDPHWQLARRCIAPTLEALRN